LIGPRLLSLELKNFDKSNIKTSGTTINSGVLRREVNIPSILGISGNIDFLNYLNSAKGYISHCAVRSMENWPHISLQAPSHMILNSFTYSQCTHALESHGCFARWKILPNNLLHVVDLIIIPQSVLYIFSGIIAVSAFTLL